MATYTKQLLSGSPNGLAVKVTQTATAGNTVHTAIAGTTSFDEVWLWAQNNHTADVVLTIEFGTASADGNIIVTVPYKAGLFPILPGFLLQNTLVISAFAGVASVIELYGFVNRIEN